MHKKIYIFLILIIIILIGINFLQDKQINNNKEDISEQIIIPVKAHIIVDTGVYESSRSKENIISLLEKANRIWNQANIYFQLEEIVMTNVDVGTISNIINGNNFEILTNKNFADDKINLFLVQNLNSIN